MKIGGIYCIENIVNGKKYIGQAIDLRKRKNRHLFDLSKNKHPNTHLQRAYNKHGKDYFKFKILIYCESFELTRYEQFFVDYYEKENLYNICLECVDSKLGIPHSEESKQKISENHADFSDKNGPMYGKHHSEKVRQKISEWHIGTHLSKETKEKISKTKSGKHLSEETKEKISKTLLGKNAPNFGKHLSEETKQKISESRIGTCSGENNPMYGRHHTEESKKKISDTKKRYRENKKKTTS